jgi:hypothetical protein
VNGKMAQSVESFKDVLPAAVCWLLLQAPKSNDETTKDDRIKNFISYNLK